MSMLIDVYSPFDRAVIGAATQYDAGEIEARLARAEATFKDRDGWLEPHARAARLKRLARLLEAEAEAFALLIAREGGKPLTDARVEVARAINGVEMAAEGIAHLAGAEIPMGLTPASVGRKAFTSKEPIGVVVAISAFNHPLNLIVHQAAPALATGCPVLVKPARATPMTCERFVALAHEAGFDEGWIQMALCDNEVASGLVADPRVAFLTFIGSARVGWMLRSKLAPGARCALEHGGVAPAIIDASADLDQAIPQLLKAGYYHAGQVCVSAQRLYVHESLFDAFLDRFSAEVAALKVGDPTLPETQLGPLIHPREVARVGSWVDAAMEGGAALATGGARLSETLYAPTLLVEPPRDAAVSTQEVFGPVTCLYRYSDLDAAIAEANRLDVAFQASIYATDLRAALRAGERLDALAVMVNDHTAFRVDWMPFGGRRASGYGVGGIPYTMEDMVQDKMIVLNMG